MKLRRSRHVVGGLAAWELLHFLNPLQILEVGLTLLAASAGRKILPCGSVEEARPLILKTAFGFEQENAKAREREL
jgi:hypothetical protein